MNQPIYLTFLLLKLGGGAALLQQIHILLPLTRVTQFKNVNERLLKSLEVEMKKKKTAESYGAVFVVVRVVSRREDWKKDEEDNSLGAPTYPWLPKDCMKNIYITHTLPGRCAKFMWEFLISKLFT